MKSCDNCCREFPEDTQVCPYCGMDVPELTEEEIEEIIGKDVEG